jgi:hypothetical protein
MVRPRLTDDGRTVVLDLHGASVDDAVRMIRRVARLASGRGRATLRVVHGSSTSDPRARNRTIRHALNELLETGDLRPWAVDAVRAEGHTLIALAAGTPDPARLGQADLQEITSRY